MFTQENFLPNLLVILATVLVVVAGGLIVARHRSVKSKAENSRALLDLDQKLWP